MAGSKTEVVLGCVNEAFRSFIDGFKEKQKDCVCFICHRERRALYFANSYVTGYGKALIIHAAPLLLMG